MGHSLESLQEPPPMHVQNASALTAWAEAGAQLESVPKPEPEAARGPEPE